MNGLVEVFDADQLAVLEKGSRLPADSGAPDPGGGLRLLDLVP
jgi:hypothetical protein